MHYINSSPVFIQVRRNRSREPALGGREKQFNPADISLVGALFPIGASITRRSTPLTWRAPESPLRRARPSRPSSDQEWFAEFEGEERAGSPPQVAPKCYRAKLNCLLDCTRLSACTVLVACARTTRTFSHDRWRSRRTPVPAPRRRRGGSGRELVALVSGCSGPCPVLPPSAVRLSQAARRRGSRPPSGSPRAPPRRRGPPAT